MPWLIFILNRCKQHTYVQQREWQLQTQCFILQRQQGGAGQQWRVMKLWQILQCYGLCSCHVLWKGAGRKQNGISQRSASDVRCHRDLLISLRMNKSAFASAIFAVCRGSASSLHRNAQWTQSTSDACPVGVWGWSPQKLETNANFQLRCPPYSPLATPLPLVHQHFDSTFDCGH